jgi:hypothetical protein
MTKTAIVSLLNAALLIAMACGSSTSQPKGNGGANGTAANGTGNGSAISTGGSGSGAAPNAGGPSVMTDAGPVVADEFGLIPLSLLGGDGGLGSACEGDTREPEPKPVVLQMVIDTSSSMVKVAHNTPASGPNKWTVTRDALNKAVDSLLSMQQSGSPSIRICRPR